MAVITRENFAELESVIRTFYDLEMKKKVDYVPKFFNMEKSNRSEEKHFGIGSIGLMQKWTGKVHYDTFEKRWPVTYRHQKYDNGLTIEREILEFKEYSEVKRRARILAHSVYVTKQTHAASVFNNAFDGTNYPGADGKALCASNHPYSPSNSSEYQGNVGTTALSLDAVLDARMKMMKFTDDKGTILGVNPRLIIVPVGLMDTAKTICKTDKIVGAADNDINPAYGELDYIVFPWLTDQNNWFLVDPDLMKLYLNWYTAREPVPEYTDDFDTEVGKYKVVGMWSFNWDEWFWIYGSNVTGS